MEIDPRIAERLRKTLVGRIATCENQADTDLHDMISQCRELDRQGFPGFSRIADKLETYQGLLRKHSPHSKDGQLIRDSLINLSAELSDLFSKMAGLAEETARSSAS